MDNLKKNEQPSHRFTPQDVRSFRDDESDNTKKTPELNEIAHSVAAQYDNNSLSPSMLSGIVRLVDVCIMILVGYTLFFFYVGFSPNNFAKYTILIFGGTLLCLLFLELSQCYRLASLKRPFHLTSRFLMAYGGSFSVMVMIAFLFKLSSFYSRVWFSGWAIGGFVLIMAMRFIISRAIISWSRNGKMERRAVLVGGGKIAESLIRSIEGSSHNDIRICGIFDDRDEKRSPMIIAGYPKLGTIDHLVEFARIAHIDLVIVALPITAEKRVLTMLKKLWVLPCDIRLSAHLNQLQFRPHSYSYIGNVPMLDIFDKPITGWDSVAKRLFDVLFSILGIIAFSPIMLITAIAIKLESKGPVLFKQMRHGFNNEMIEVYKFRSMYSDQCDFTAQNAVTKDDPRVTKVGRFIRKTSIDELPQFFNTLKGSLSLVGPRPHAVSAQSRSRLYNDVVDGYFARHKVKPGVTGWAQINGLRGEIDNDEKIKKRTEYDLDYIENWSIFLDLKILFLTPVSLVTKSENAY